MTDTVSTLVTRYCHAAKPAIRSTDETRNLPPAAKVDAEVGELCRVTAVFEFINELKEAIIIGYQAKIVQQLRAERCEENDGASDPLEGYDPF